ncbi:DUF697 domain-containing protein [Promicromonospora sp. MEB111]|uniref:DUF697 domain-containing protein n=1 Tax=Promicromonospora sp. MEB111 TaxID=3040301 RepID=UPI00254E5F63|nr:DUF697 domain-containing protein [Promicromonospora sp. MEB111]
MTGAQALDDEPFLDPAPLIDAAKSERDRIGRFNLVVVGGTGVGKSTLVNAVFGEDLAETGIGLPVTKGINYYTNADKSLGIWDFEGFEIGSRTDPAESVRADLKTIAAGPAHQRISAVWYCVLSTLGKIQPAEIAVLREFRRQGVPVVIVLTKVARRMNLTGTWTASDDSQSLRDWLEGPLDREGESFDLPVDAVVLTAAKDQGRFGGPAHGLHELVETTLELSPGDTKDALRVAQRLSLPLKRALCRRYIAAASGAAAAAAATPIPLADAAIIAPIQLTMMGKIASVYGLDIKVVLSAQALAQLAVQFAGKALARSFLKLIPGLGNVINAAVAGALTTATGEAWMRLCERVYNGKLPIEMVETAWKDYAPTVMQVVNALVKQRTKK